jgi:hypothetical protein
MLKLLTFLTLMIAGNMLPVFAQDKFPYDVYKPRTLSEIIVINSNLKSVDVTIGKKDTPQIALNADFLHSQARLKFLNKSRPVAPDRKELLKIWQKTFAIDEKIVGLYENEYLFKECDTEYWIPVQKQVAAYFPKELKEDDMISLFFMRIGGQKLKTTNNWDWLFLANEFIKY